MIIFNIVIGFIVSILVLTSVGVGLLSYVYPEIKRLEKLVLGTVLGISVFASVLFFTGKLFGSIQSWIVYIFLIVGIILFPHTVRLIKDCIGVVKRHKLLSVFSLFASFSLAITASFSWIETKAGLFFQSGVVHDSTWHIALINKLNQSIPPEHPSSFDHSVEEYHYLFDLVIAGLSKLHLSPTVLFYQISPLILAILLAISSLILVDKLTSGKNSSLFSVIFLVFFTGNFGYLLPLVVKGLEWSESSFWVSQTFNVMINPQLIYSFTVLLITLSLLFNDYHYKDSTKQKFVSHIIISLLIASSIGFKSYLFPILGLLYAFYLLIIFLQKKGNAIWYGIIFLIISLPYMFSFVNLSTSTFSWSPLWFPQSMFEAPDRLDFPKMILVEQHYKEAGSMLKYYLIKILQVIIFYVGNLGTRSLIIFLPFLLIFKSFRKFHNSPISYITIIGFLASSIVSLLVIQKGVVWNSIQFWYYSLIFADIILALIIGYVWNELGKYKKVLAYVITLLFIIFSIPSYLQTMDIKLNNFEKISNDDIAQIKKIPKNSRVLICKEEGEFFYQTALVSSITDSSVYFADPDQLSIVNVSVDEYKNQLKRIFADKDPHLLDKLVKDEKIDYIICNDKNWYNIFVGLRCVNPSTNNNEKRFYSVKVLQFCPVDSSLYLE